MNKEQHDSLLIKMVAIERDYKTGDSHQAFTDLMRINLKIISELYETQKELNELQEENTYVI